MISTPAMIVIRRYYMILVKYAFYPGKSVPFQILEDLFTEGAPGHVNATGYYLKEGPSNNYENFI